MTWGAATLPALGRKFGEHAVSETALVDQVLQPLPADAVVMADAGYGIFAVAQRVRQSGRDFVFRLTKQRFAALQRRATLLVDDAGGRTWSCRWRPTRGERRKHGLPLTAELTVRLHETPLPDGEPLRLATTLPDDAATLAALYARRVQVEIDLRNLKVVLQTEQMRTRSADLFEKELLASLTADNLVVQFRRLAAEQAQLPPRRLSFQRTWTTFRTFLLGHAYSTPEAWRRQFDRALCLASHDKLPHRPGRREPRVAYQRRPKSNQFPKRKPPPPPSSLAASMSVPLTVRERAPHHGAQEHAP